MVANGLPKLRGRLAESGIQNQVLASALGMDPSLLSAILRGRRVAPEGFEARVTAALDRLEAAEAAAEEARQRVLAETAG